MGTHMKYAGDPRFTDKLQKPSILTNRRMALTFIPDDHEANPIRAQVEVRGDKIREMVTKLRTGKVRLQIATGFSERDFIFEDGAEVLFLHAMLDEFIHGLADAAHATPEEADESGEAE